MSCSICGHAFEDVVTQPAVNTSKPPKIEVEVDNIQTAHTPIDENLRAKLNSKSKTQRRIPWGVMGVGGVIILLALFAGLAGQNLTGARRPDSVITPVVAYIRDDSKTQVSQPTTASSATALPTSLPAPPTLTPIPPILYTVQDGDTCGAIADKYKIPLRTFLTFNNLNEDFCIIVPGGKVRIPPPTPTPGPSPTLPPGVTQLPTSTRPPQIIYEVQDDDVCGTIAEKFDVPVSQIIAQNRLDEDCTIQVGQKIVVIFATPTPNVTSTSVVARTPTPRTGFSAPQLVAPIDGEIISATQSSVQLQWVSIGLLREDEWYVVHVQPAGAVSVPLFETKTTSLRLSSDLLNGQPQRDFVWWVEVRRRKTSIVGNSVTYDDTPFAPSLTRRFSWIGK